MVKPRLIVGTLTKGGKEEVRIQVREPFASELMEHVGETIIFVAYLPETEAEKALYRLLKESRIRL